MFYMFLNFEISLQEKKAENKIDTRSREEITLEGVRRVQKDILKISKFFFYIWILSSLVGNVFFYSHFLEIIDIQKNDLIIILLVIFFVAFLLLLFFLSLYLALCFQYLVYKIIYKTGTNRKYRALKSNINEIVKKMIKFVENYIKNVNYRKILHDPNK